MVTRSCFYYNIFAKIKVVSTINKNNLAYLVGVAIGDGNLSNPNGRATRLRVTCDTKYPGLIRKISGAIQEALPNNKVSIIKRAKTYIDISCYSNKWENWLGWQAKGGPKYKQNVSVPEWIKTHPDYTISCLRGLFETDGSIYSDRGYKMVNFTTIIPKLSQDVLGMIGSLGFTAHIQKTDKVKNKRKTKYIVRVSKESNKFIDLIGIEKV